MASVPDPALRSFSIVYLREGCVVARDCVNAVKDCVQGRKLVEYRQVGDPDIVANPQVALKALLYATWLAGSRLRCW